MTATFYDDAELAAVEAIRRAATELSSNEPRSADVHEMTLRMYEQHGSSGVAALVVVLARWMSLTFKTLAEQQGQTLAQYLDGWDMHVMEQHEHEEEEN